MPRNASLNGQGFRFYEWTEPGMDPVRVLSVTSIRRLNGLNHMLVEWQLGNVTKLAMGIRKQTVIGPRGGVKEVYVKDGPFPGEFVRRMIASKGEQKALDDVRKWLRSTADEPRDIAAVRGSTVHKLIELNVALDRVDDTLIRRRFEDEWRGERRKVKPDVTEDDVNFVLNGMRQYWHMRAEVPFVILAQEPQVWNLTAGYAGSADVLIWFLGTWEEVMFSAEVMGNDGQEDMETVSKWVFHPLPGIGPEEVRYWQTMSGRGLVTAKTIAEVGGEVVLGDWKTSKGVYTDHVIQMCAYQAAEFVGADGRRDPRLTELLEGSMKAGLFHIRPDGWNLDFTEFRQDVLRAFLGSVAFARFNALYPKPQPLFAASVSGSAPDTEPSAFVDEDD